MKAKIILPKHVGPMLDEFLAAKEKWRKSVGASSRKSLKKDYQAIEKKLIPFLPEKISYMGLIIVKGYNPYGEYLAVYTNDSYEKAEMYRATQKALRKNGATNQ